MYITSESRQNNFYYQQPTNENIEEGMLKKAIRSLDVAPYIFLFMTHHLKKLPFHKLLFLTLTPRHGIMKFTL